MAFTAAWTKYDVTRKDRVADEISGVVTPVVNAKVFKN